MSGVPSSPVDHNHTKSSFVFTICFCICHLLLHLSSASVTCFCICHLLLHLPSASASVICFCIAICHLLLHLPSARCLYMVDRHSCVHDSKPSELCVSGHCSSRCPGVCSRCGGVRWTLQRWRGHAVSGPCCWPSCSAGTLLRTPPVTSKPSCSPLSRYLLTRMWCPMLFEGYSPAA